jgi:methylmalonyl-CoA mutase, N-terminal domain
VADLVDPLGGAYAIEHLTNELEGRAEQYIRKIDEMGGMVEAIRNGYPQKEIQDASYAAQRTLESKQSIVVGINEFVTDEAAPVELLRVDPSVAERQAARLAQLRAERDQAATRRALDALRLAARDERENLVPHILDAVKAEATLGEISDAMREVFGQHKEILVL